jgi:hypothetical protein
MSAPGLQAQPESSAVAIRDRNIAAVAAVLLLIAMPVGWIGGKTTTGDVIGLVVAVLINLALMAGMFLWLIPRERAASARTARTALIVGIVSILLCGVFWTGLPFPIAAGAIALGLSVREVSPDSGKATAAVVLGSIALLAAFVLLLIG